MTADLLLREFARIADAPDLVAQLRRFVLDLAVRGKLVEQTSSDGTGADLLSMARRACERSSGRSTRDRDLRPTSDIAEPYELPSTWIWARFGDIVRFSAGRTPSRNDLSFWSSGAYPWVSIADMPDGGQVMATKETVSHKAKELVFRVDPEPAGTMIMSFKLTIGKIARLGVAAYHNEAIISITPWVRELDPFLFLVLPERARRGATKGAIKGATLNRDSLDGLLVPLPPLAEQHRIVAKVEELMALCDQSEAAQREREARRDGLRSASLQRLTASNGDAKRGAADAQFFLDLSQRLITKPQHVADLRQTILELAVRGRLVPQDSQDETAAELLGARVMRDDRAAELWTLPAGWEWSCLAKLGEQIGGGTPSKSNPNFWIGSTPWVSPKDMKVDLILDAIDHVSTDAIAASTTKLIPVPALLMVVRGMILSHSFPSALSGVPLTMNQDMKALIPFRADLAPMLLLLVKAMKEHVLALVQHSTHGTCRLNTADLFGLLLPIPPLAEQHRIVAKVDELMRVCDELEASLAYAWDGRVRLLEALLHEALGDAALPNAVGGGTAV